MDHRERFDGLRVAVTGGTSGLGLALVDAFARAGAQVAFVARDPHRVSAVQLRRPGTHGIAADVATKDAIHPMAMQVTSALGGLDVLINNASSLGPVPLAPLADTDCEDFELALRTNLLGPFRLTKALLGALAASAREGRPALVVNITSDAAVSAYPGWGAYGASKAALAHLSRIWDAELKEHGIRVIAHDPGDMDTPLHALAMPDADRAGLKAPAQSAAELLERIAQEIA
jgi:NAD(P)-dependent dehydrogenase (short-subunit alcohol dehydrogenase family)